MPVDPSIPLAAANNQPNVFQTYGQVLGLQGNMLQQKALGQQIQANIAASDAFKQATDPTTGKVDYNKATAILSQGPAAYNVPQLQNQISEQQKRQQDIQLGQQDLLQKMQNAHGQLGALLVDPNLGKTDSRGAIYQNIVDTYKTGLVGNDPQKLQDMLSQVPTDPAAQRQWVMQKYLASQNALPQAFQAVQPNVQNVNTGGQQTLINTNPAAGPVGQPIAQFQNTMTPGEASTPTPYFDQKTGQPMVMTRQQFVDQSTPQAPAQPATVQPITQAQPGVPQGAFQGDPENIRRQIMAMPEGADKEGAIQAFNQQYAGKSAPQAQQPAAQPKPTGLATGPALGVTEGTSGLAKGGADRFNALTDQAGNVRNTVAGYDAALNALDQLNNSGPQVSNIQKIKATMEALGLKPTGQDTADWQSLKKYLANAGAQASSAAGFAGSDARAASFGAGQPDPNTMNPTALRDAINYVKAQNNGVLAKQQAAAAFLGGNNNDTTKYPQFEAKWNKTYNPDVMYFVSLPDSQKGAYFNSLPKTKQTQLQSSYNAMHALGAF